MSCYAQEIELMSLSISDIQKEALRIDTDIQSGKLVDACSMSAANTPAKEAWSTAEELIEKGPLSSLDRKQLIALLGSRLEERTIDHADDFDLIYEFLLSVLKNK